MRRREDRLDPALWGLPPKRRLLLKARIMNQYRLARLRLRRRFVCKRKGHDPKYHRPSEMYWDGHWSCSRCATYLGPWRCS